MYKFKATRLKHCEHDVLMCCCVCERNGVMWQSFTAEHWCCTIIFLQTLTLKQGTYHCNVFMYWMCESASCSHYSSHRAVMPFSKWISWTVSLCIWDSCSFLIVWKFREEKILVTPLNMRELRIFIYCFMQLQFCTSQTGSTLWVRASLLLNW